MSKQSQELIQTFSRIIHKFSEIYKEARRFGTDFTLYSSEIHMIDVIGKNPGINVTEIAVKLGITKGAVPKIICKLIAKDFIYRYQEKDNKKMVLFQLTDKGRVAFTQHLEFHRNFDKGIMEKLDALSASEIDFLKYTFAEIENYADDLHKK